QMYQAKFILTAHHLDDKIETFFFHLLRGTKLTGLINMTEQSGSILRPLLKIEKSKILEYLHQNNLIYFEDSSNLHDTHTRNKLRLHILPKLETIHPNHKGNISQLLTYFEEIKSHIDFEVEKFLGNQKQENYFNIQDFQSLSPLLQKEVIRYIYYNSHNNSTIGLSEGNIAEVIRFIGGKNNKTVKQIGEMKMEKDNLVIKYFTDIY
ncbi:tRNA lysidine(34) synthetase TilS, partial [Candidatus Gracilibacteria bacterium]|nr:tRNA lysidine(34) synthetase TilS [Candidatus Gracilibacteria bacterium]